MTNNRLMDYARRWKSSDINQRELVRTIKQKEEDRKKEQEEKRNTVNIPQSVLEKQKSGGVLTLESKVGFRTSP